jgi:hypothetical protein
VAKLEQEIRYVSVTLEFARASIHLARNLLAASAIHERLKITLRVYYTKKGGDALIGYVHIPVDHAYEAQSEEKPTYIPTVISIDCA